MQSSLQDDDSIPVIDPFNGSSIFAEFGVSRGTADLWEPARLL